jgi:hypothetical protein
MTRSVVLLGLVLAASAWFLVFAAAAAWEVYAQRRRGLQLDGAHRWAQRLTYLRWSLFALLVAGVVAVSLATRDFALAVFVAVGWFALSLTLRVASGLLLRLERR